MCQYTHTHTHTHTSGLENRDSKVEKEKGITLIALVITIIVLLLLAGISISMLTGDNSILKNAQKAKIETGNAGVEEKVKIAVMGAYDDKGKFNEEKLKSELDKLGVKYSETEKEILIELPNGKQILISKATGEIREGIHKILYNYNGGEDTGSVPNDDTEYKEGENITIKFTPKPEREGFEFLGWSTNQTATDAEYKADGTTTVTVEKRSITLYAVWRGIPYTISYDANTGTGAVPTDGSTHIKGENVAVGFTPQPTKTGYTFIGWSEDKDSESAEYTADGIKTIKMPAKNVKLYAIWMANTNTAYTVEHYQMNTSGTYETTPTASNTYTNGTTGARLTIADLKQTGDDYAGFTYKKGQVDGTDATTTTVLGDGSRVIKLYYERNRYTISFDGNGGSTPTEITDYYGATITLPTLTRRAYTFDGWYTQANGGTKVNHTTMTLDGERVYAHWTFVGLVGIALSIGDQVSVGEEKFYVIEDSPASSNSVKLWAKYNLNLEGTAQLNGKYDETKCAFSSSCYWVEEYKASKNKYIDLNLENAPEDSAYKKSKRYGESIGGKGRLMNLAERTLLFDGKNDNRPIANFCDDAVDGFISSWIGYWNPGNGNVNLMVRCLTSTDGSGSVSGGSCGYESKGSGVRPVIIIDKEIIK